LIGLVEDLLDSLNLPQTTPLAPPTEFFEALALRLSAMKKGGVPDVDFAGRWLVQAFRDGKLGRWTLDGLGRGGEAVDDFRELSIEEVVESDEGEKEVVLKMGERMERRKGYLSGSKQDQVQTLSTTPLAPETSSPLTLEAISQPFPRSFNPAPTSPPTPLDSPVISCISSHLSALSSQSSQLDLQSSHQAKKAQKVQQQKLRDFKRKSHEIVQLKPTSFRDSKSSGGFQSSKSGRGSGFGSKPMMGKARGPVGKGLSSGRRRKYRR